MTIVAIPRVVQTMARFPFFRGLPGRPNGRVLRLLRQIVVAGSVAYLLAVLALGVGQLRTIQWDAYVEACLIALALYPISVGVQAIAWSLGLSWFRHRMLQINARDVQVFASSHLMKRLPGGAWYVAGRVASYQEQGVSAKETILASIVEWSSIFPVAGISYLTFVLVSVKPLFAQILLAGALAAALGWAVGVMLLGGSISRDPALDLKGWWKAGAIGAIVAELYLVAFINAATILYVLVRAAPPSGFGFAESIQTWSLVACTSIVATILPFALGVRDVTLVAILSPYVTPPVAVVIAIMHRLLFTAGDLVWGLALLAVSHRLPHRLAPGR